MLTVFMSGPTRSGQTRISHLNATGSTPSHRPVTQVTSPTIIPSNNRSAMPDVLNDAAVQAKAIAVMRTFTPAAPVTDPELFAGRTETLVRVLLAASQFGQHVVIDGRPGVGKTSLANMIAPSLSDGAHVVIVDGKPADAAVSDPGATLVVVGAGSAESLIPAGLPVARFLLSPMTAAEASEIVDRAFRRLSMTIDADARALIASVTQGHPGETHRLAQYAAVEALLHSRSVHVTRPAVAAALRRIVEEPSSLAATWRQATKSPRRNLFQELLLACALAPKHDLGWFRPSVVSAPLKRICGKPYEAKRFGGRLQDFSTTRGPLLEHAGEINDPFYRFVNPSMEAWIRMRAYVDGLWNGNHGSAD